MKLDDLLRHDNDAFAFFSGLSAPMRDELRRRGGDVASLAALREYAQALDARQAREDGSPLDVELRAKWTMEHQA